MVSRSENRAVFHCADVLFSDRRRLCDVIGGLAGGSPRILSGCLSRWRDTLAAVSAHHLADDPPLARAAAHSRYYPEHPEYYYASPGNDLWRPILCNPRITPSVF